MKKFLFGSILGCILFASCSKEELDAPEGEVAVDYAMAPGGPIIGIKVVYDIAKRSKNCKSGLSLCKQKKSKNGGTREVDVTFADLSESSLFLYFEDHLPETGDEFIIDEEYSLGVEISEFFEVSGIDLVVGSYEIDFSNESYHGVVEIDVIVH